MHYLLNGIYPAVMFQMCSFNNVQVIARFIDILNIFQCFRFHSNHFFLLINKSRNDVHYLLNGIYPAVKFQMCIFNTLRVIAEYRFLLFSLFRFHRNHFSLYQQKSYVDYPLISIYPAVKFQMCIFNIFLVIA